MNYSQKSHSKNGKWLAGALGKTFFVLIVATWFCQSTSFPVSTKSEAAMLPAGDGMWMPGKALSEEIQEDELTFENPTVGVLTSAFGERNGRRHNGIDIGADFGTKICAAAEGTVTFAGEMSGYGNYIILMHRDGFETAYAHCDSLLVTKGESVQAGQLIAYMGSTGNSTGPHLHFEVKQNGEFCDPQKFVFYGS